MHPAILFQKLKGGAVECQLCAHFCRLQPGQTGPCRVRHNVGGTLVTSAYGRPVALAVEPIEKKYLFHVYPGAQTLSLGTPGCNMGCKYCINWRVSQRGVDDSEPEVPPAAVIEKAVADQVDGIALTYTEPTIFLEYALDIARLARQAGLWVVAKSNGYMTPAALQVLAPWLAAINIDLKGWEPATHYQLTGAHLQPVLENLRLAKTLGLWLEISTLIVPGLNDQPEDLNALAHFIATELGPDTPWHLQRFFPNYRLLDRPVTAQSVLEQAVAAGRQAGLRYVYAKEVARGRMFQTYCPGCQGIVIEREGFMVTRNKLRSGCCAGCGQAIPIYNLHQPATAAHSLET